MEKSLSLTIQEQQLQRKLSIANQIVASNGSIRTVSDLVNKCGLSQSEAIDLMNDDSFLSLICNYTNAENNLFYHTTVIPKVREVIETGDNKSIISAVNLFAKLTGRITPASKRIEKSLEDLLEQELNKVDSKTIELEKSVNGNIFESTLSTEEEEEELDKLFESEEEEEDE